MIPTEEQNTATTCTLHLLWPHMSHSLMQFELCLLALSLKKQTAEWKPKKGRYKILVDDYLKRLRLGQLRGYPSFLPSTGDVLSFLPPYSLQGHFALSWFELIFWGRWSLLYCLFVASDWSYTLIYLAFWIVKGIPKMQYVTERNERVECLQCSLMSSLSTYRDAK